MWRCVLEETVGRIILSECLTRPKNLTLSPVGTIFSTKMVKNEAKPLVNQKLFEELLGTS